MPRLTPKAVDKVCNRWAAILRAHLRRLVIEEDDKKIKIEMGYRIETGDLDLNPEFKDIA